MSRSLDLLHGCNAYLRSMTKTVSRPIVSTADSQTPTELCKRVLIVEFRDEVFADLKYVFENYGCKTERAVSGAAVAHQIKRFTPDLLLVNENMPDESGWLITCKLHVTRSGPPVWLYAVRRPPTLADWKELCGADEVLEYGGVLSQLALQVHGRLENWKKSSDAGLRCGTSSPEVTGGLRQCA